MSEPRNRTSRAGGVTALTRAVVRYRDGAAVIMHVLRTEAAILRRAGFRPYAMRLAQDLGCALEANLWSQDAPHLTDYLNAAYLLFGDAPGSLSWDSECGKPHAARLIAEF